VTGNPFAIVLNLSLDDVGVLELVVIHYIYLRDPDDRDSLPCHGNSVVLW
jgi:hypothetical protein